MDENINEPIAWESTTIAFTKYVTDSRYQKFSREVQQWYKPYQCSACASTGQDVPCAYPTEVNRKLMDEVERLKTAFSECERRLSVLDRLFYLEAHDVVFFGTYNEAIGNWDDHWHPAVCVNDTFNYGADADSLPEDQIDVLTDIHKRFGHEGVIAWSATRRGCEPLEKWRTAKYLEARAAIDAAKEGGA